MGDWALPSNSGMTSRLGPAGIPSDSSFLNDWASRSAIWGTHHGIGEAIDRYMGLHAPVTSSKGANRIAGFGIDSFEGKSQGALTYGKILKLDGDHLTWKDLSWKGLKNQVSANSYELQQTVKSGNLKHFFSDVSLKQYVKDTLWKANIQPIQSLLAGSKQNLCMNLRSGGAQFDENGQGPLSLLESPRRWFHGQSMAYRL